MGRKPKEKRPLTEEEKAALKKQKAEYMKKYYKVNKERLLAAANNRYRDLSNGKRYTTRPIKPGSMEKWNMELEERLQEQLTPMVRIWVLSQIKWNKEQIDAKEGRNKQEELG